MGTLFREALSPEERFAAFRLGAYLKFASAGVRPSRIDEFVKQAAIPSMFTPSGIFKTIAAVSVLTGVPIGVAAHIVGRRIRASRREDTELRMKTDYYADAARQLESRLAAATTLK